MFAERVCLTWHSRVPQKVLAIKSSEMSVIFAVDQMTGLDLMRSLKKRLVCEFLTTDQLLPRY